MNSCVICHHKARAPITAGTVTGSVEESLVDGSIFQPLSQIHISKSEFKNEISTSALLDIQLTVFCVCGVDSFLPELEHL